MPKRGPNTRTLLGWPPPKDEFWDEQPPAAKVGLYPRDLDRGKPSRDVLDRLNSPEGRALIARYRDACLKEKKDAPPRDA